MKQKEYEKKFREMFGVAPFSDEEIEYFRAMLFAQSHRVDNCSASFYNKYMGDYNNYAIKRENDSVKEEVGQLFVDKAIKYLEEQGYKVEKR